MKAGVPIIGSLFRSNLFKELEADLAQYLPKEAVEKVHHAYKVAYKAHDGQTRSSGEPYITHPVAVARILASMHMDDDSIAAALLHDVIEDTEIDKDTLKVAFGEDVAELVDGVSKLTQIQFKSRAEAQAENFRKMVLAMSQDIRVIIIKLSDRLHNMRTLNPLSTEKRRRIAQETLEIYAPVANRLGMNNFRIEFEDLGFSAMYPMRSRVLKKSVRKAIGNRRELVRNIELSLTERLVKAGIKGHVYGRQKHLYSIYKKMHSKHLPFSEVNDVFAFRIIVDSVDTCYRTLGAVHNLYKPVPGRFKDYIAIPKANGYQSLHTVLFGPHGSPVEIQIRTERMHQMAENGIAAHWLYKTGEDQQNQAHEHARGWVKGLLELQQHAGTSIEFIENVKIDLFPDEVYVFTPTGKIMELPAGATAVDFAYAVHTDVGNACIAAKINRQLAPLSTRLSNGQTVEIITAPGARPNPAWLNFVVTGKARSNIRHFLKTQKRAESCELGHRLLEKALESHQIVLDELSAETLLQTIASLGFETIEALYEEIGLGNRSALLVARHFANQLSKGTVQGDQGVIPLMIKGTEGMVITFARCCHPIPGDPIIGVLSAGMGIAIHADGCNNIQPMHGEQEKRIPVLWEKEVQGEFEVELKVHLENKRGALAQLAISIADAGSNIDNIATEYKDAQQSQFSLIISVKDRVHLARIIRRIRQVKPVLKVIRAR